LQNFLGTKQGPTIHTKAKRQISSEKREPKKWSDSCCSAPACHHPLHLKSDSRGPLNINTVQPPKHGRAEELKESRALWEQQWQEPG